MHYCFTALDLLVVGLKDMQVLKTFFYKLERFTSRSDRSSRHYLWTACGDSLVFKYLFCTVSLYEFVANLPMSLPVKEF